MHRWAQCGSRDTGRNLVVLRIRVSGVPNVSANPRSYQFWQRYLDKVSHLLGGNATINHTRGYRQPDIMVRYGILRKGERVYK